MSQAASKDKRQMILDATLRLLSSSGFHGFSMKQLATEAGLAAGTIYIYFKDRDALITELHSTIIEAFAEAAFANHDPKQSLKQQYQRICSNLWHFCINNRCATLSKAQFDHLPPEVLRSQRQNAWQQFEPVHQLFEQGRQEGLIKDLADDVLVSLSFEPYMFMASQHLLGVFDIDKSQLEKILDASWDAVATESGRTQS